MKDTKNPIPKATIWATIIGMTSLGIFIGIDLILWPGINNHYWFICPSLVLEFLVFVVMTVPKLNQKSKDFDRLFIAVRKIVIDNTKKEPFSLEPDLEENIHQLERIVELGLERARQLDIVRDQFCDLEEKTEKELVRIPGSTPSVKELVDRHIELVEELGLYHQTSLELIGPVMKAVIRLWNKGQGGRTNLTPTESQTLRRLLGRGVIKTLVSTKTPVNEIVEIFGGDEILLADTVASAAKHRIVDEKHPLYQRVSVQVFGQSVERLVEPSQIERRAQLTEDLKKRQSSVSQNLEQTASDITDPDKTQDSDPIKPPVQINYQPVVGDTYRHRFNRAQDCCVGTPGYDKIFWSVCRSQLETALKSQPNDVALPTEDLAADLIEVKTFVFKTGGFTPTPWIQITKQLEATLAIKKTVAES